MRTASAPRVILCSSDSFGEPAVQALAEAGWLTALVTQPDRPRGRGRKVEPLPIRVLAESQGIPVLTPDKIATTESREALLALAPEFLVIAAYAHYLPASVRSIPTQACLNIHPSLLPQYRGPAPVQAALWQGDTVTGVAIHYTEKGIDTGDILAVETASIAPDDTGLSLRQRLGELGSRLLIRVIEAIRAGTTHGTPQDHEAATLTRLLTAADRDLPLRLSAAALANRVRALSSDPGALLYWKGEPLRVLTSSVIPSPDAPLVPGLAWAPGKGRLAVRCGEGALELLTVQPTGRGQMPVSSWLNGLRGELPESFELRVGDPRPLIAPIAEAALLAAIQPGGVHG